MLTLRSGSVAAAESIYACIAKTDQASKPADVTCDNTDGWVKNDVSPGESGYTGSTCHGQTEYHLRYFDPSNGAEVGSGAGGNAVMNSCYFSFVAL